MKRILIVLLLATASPAYADGLGISEEYDYYALLSHLLSINEDRHTYVDENGIRQHDELKAFKEIDSLYSRYVHRHGDKGELTEEQAKVIMFLAFYSVNRNSAAVNEYLASDFKPIFDRNMSLFINSMAELPFLIPSACNRLNANFGFEGENVKGKSHFVTNLKDLLSEYLSEPQVEECLEEFTE